MLKKILYIILFLIKNKNVYSHSHNSHYKHLYDGTIVLKNSDIISIVEHPELIYIKSNYEKKCYYKYFNIYNSNKIIITIKNNIRYIDLSNITSIDNIITHRCINYENSDTIIIIIIIIFIIILFCSLNKRKYNYIL